LIDNLDSNDLEPLTKVSDIIIADAAINGKPVVVSQELLNAKDSKLRVVVDLDPDSSNSIACTLRQSTPEEPFYGYLPSENREVEVFHPAAIVVVAVLTFGTEFPKEVSEDFGKQLMEQVIPAFFDQDVNGILKKMQL
jgi:alanine dehydrogenase